MRSFKPGRHAGIVASPQQARPRTPGSLALLMALLSSTTLMGMSGCRPRPMRAPYALAPTPTVLLAATRAQLSTIQVPRAKIHQALRPGASLEMVAQAPANFAGKIHLGGHEILQIAVDPDAYSLRVVESRDGALKPGFYTGPPSRCAVKTLVGVSLSPQQLSVLLLGGGPMIDAPQEIFDQRWDTATGREIISLKNTRHEQQLEFVWRQRRWWFAGATVWKLSNDRHHPRRWLWTIRHEKFHTVGAYVLPKRTVILQPSSTVETRRRRRRRRRSRGHVLELIIAYQEQIPNPSLGPPQQENDDWDDDWDDETIAHPRRDELDASTSPDRDGSKSTTVLPTPFRLDATGLSIQGDLCGK